MRWFLSWLLLVLAGLVSALSPSGSRLLVVLEDSAEKDKYSHLWGDLECNMPCGFNPLNFDGRRADNGM